MNPINDGVPAKDSTDVEASGEHLKDTHEHEDLKDKEQKISENLSTSTIGEQNLSEQKENQEKVNEIQHQTAHAENDETLKAAAVSEEKSYKSLKAAVSANKSDEEVDKEHKSRKDLKTQTEIVTENQDALSAKFENLNENSCASEVKDNSSTEVNMKEIADNALLAEAQNKLETDAAAPNDIKDLNRETDTEDDDETEEFENVEDVEIPDEEEVDEIIVPDEAEAEDLTDDKDPHSEELEKSQNGELEDEEEQSAKESDMEDNESDINLPETEADEDTTKSSSAAIEKDEDDEDDEAEAESNKKSPNTDAKEDNCSKDYEAAEELVVLEDITNNESCMEHAKPDQSNLDDDSTTQNSYDPLNCTDNKEPDEEEAENVSVKNVENENSNDSQTLEKEKNAEAKSCTKNIESEADNSLESQNCKNDELEEDDEVQFVETRNSPICIESDDDEAVNIKDTNDTSLRLPTNNNNSTINSNNIDRIDSNRRVITTATTTVTVPRNIIVTRTSARKSTAKPPQQTPLRASNSPAANVPQTLTKTKSFNYLTKSTTFNKSSFTGASTQKIVDCIELLDSSDEESGAKTSHNTQKSTTQQQRTPQKRTLLAAKGNFYKNSTNSKIPNAASNRLPHNFTPPIRQQPKKPAPAPLPPPTPQSNFLNAVQLQPAANTGANPPAFSALLSNKNVIIPNAFYGNPPSIRGTTSETDAERRTARWLENFLNQFCKPQFEPTHSCFVFLQRALKYKDFVRIKALRTSMNNHVQNASNQLNIELMSDMKTIFFKNVKTVSNYGQRFCELTCTTTPGKAVTLITHRLSGKVTLKTCNMELPKPFNSNSAANASTSSSLSSASTLTSHANSSSISVARKRQLDEDEDEYTPDKSLYKTKGKPPSENGGGAGDEDSGDTGDERKRSLRTKRTKRIDNSFSYNEDDLLAEYEIDDADDEKLAQVEIQRKVEEKRLEAQKQRQQQAKSFESAFIQAFAKSIDGPTTSTKTKNNNNATSSSSSSNQRIRLRNTATATVTNIKQYTANNDAEDLLQATWIENLENDNTQIISDDDEPQEHRIYKQTDELQREEMQQHSQPQTEYYKLSNNLTINKVPSTYPSSKYSTRAAKRTANRNQEEFITGDDDYEELNYHAKNSLYAQPAYWPKNVDPQMTVTGKNKDRCVICSFNCQRLVHHYVNEHRGCETYNSRLSATQIKKLKQGNCTASVSLYKNGQNLYEAFCIFCNKVSRFMLRYWYQHYTMHTGEYAYRCTGCGIRKPTQSLLTLHHTQGCPEVGAGIIQDYAYDAKSLQIEAKICSLCNYLQLHRSNIVKHLHTQHNIRQILPKHILTVVLMKIPAYLAAAATSTSTNAAPSANSNRRSLASSRSSTAGYSCSTDTFVIEDDDSDMAHYEEILPESSSQAPPQNHYYNYIPPYMQAAFNSGNLTFENVDAGDDLSFMICGMLDVQMNTNDAN